MTPIISPIWFYLIGIADDFTFTLWFVGLILAAAGAFSTVCVICSSESERKDPSFPILKKWRKALVIGIIFIMLGNLIPDEETCYRMMAASMITPNNIEMVGESTKNITDYIIESVDELLENK